MPETKTAIMSTTPRIPPYKVTKPIPPHKIAKPTPRTHEENQERAYIAASRRSDRSLEARMESAKRASEIHKKRTGRYYRITEETVINEQMYEEEDDAPRYRLAASMHLPNTLLQQRAQALMSIQMENRRLLGQAVNSTLQHNAQFGNQSQFVSPGMMSMQSGYPFPMSSPQMYNQSPQTPTFQSPTTPMSYVHSPYSAPNDNMRHNYHQRSTSIAEVPQYSQSAHSSPVESQHRRMSMPPPNLPSTSIKAEERIDSAVSSHESSPTTPMPQQQHNNFHYDPSYQSMGGALGPLTIELPTETSQLLASGIWPNLDESTFDRMMQQPNDSTYQQPLMYNYRPNKTSKGSNSVPTSVGLDQTLSSTPPDAKLNATSQEQPYSYGYGYNDNSMFNFENMDSFNPFSSGHNSARPTPPANEDWSSFLDNDMFGEGQYVAGG